MVEGAYGCHVKVDTYPARLFPCDTVKVNLSKDNRPMRNSS